MTEYLILPNDVTFIRTELRHAEMKLRKIFPSKVKGKLSEEAMDIIKHLDEITWIINNLADR